MEPRILTASLLKKSTLSKQILHSKPKAQIKIPEKTHLQWLISLSTSQSEIKCCWSFFWAFLFSSTLMVL